MRIQNTDINRQGKTYIIAEIGLNHNGDINIAKTLIKEAKLAGADAVKFQTFKADRLVSINSDNYQMFKELELTKQDHIELLKQARDYNIHFISTPFDIDSANMLYEIGIDAYKIASSDLINIPLIKHIIKFNKPMIISTGMGNLQEIKEIHNMCNTDRLAILHCVSNYPTKIEDINLRSIEYLLDNTIAVIGLSDHTADNRTSPIAVALGARIIEKHFTLDNNASGPDHKLSFNSDDFRMMVNNIRMVEVSLGNYGKSPALIENINKINSRVSILANIDMKKGDVLTLDNIIIKRPATGIEPKYLDDILGKSINIDIDKDDPIKFEYLEDKE